MLFKRPAKSDAIADFKKRRTLRGHHEHLPYAVFVDEQTIMMKDGAFFAAFYFNGPDVESSTNAQLDAVAGSMNNAIRTLDDGWMIETHLIRKPSMNYPDQQTFPDTVSALIDDERRSQYQQENLHYDTVTYLTITYLPEREVNQSIKKFALDTDQEIKEATLADIHQRFESKLKNFLDMIAKFMNRLERLGKEDLLTFLHYCITSISDKMLLPSIGMYLDAYLGTEAFVGGVQPIIGKKNIQVLNLVEFPTVSYPTILDRLNTLPVEYRWASRYIILGTATADKYLKKYQKHWGRKAKGFFGLLREGAGGAAKVDQDAQRMIDQIEEEIAANSSGLMKEGFVTNVVVLMHESLEKLQESVRFIKSEINPMSFIFSEESVNAVEAYLGSIPGNGYYNVRKPLLNSAVYSQIMPISSVYQGERYAPCPLYPDNSPPLFYAATTGATPYRLNLHVSDVGHTLIVGPTGKGKSVLLALIAAQHRKYPKSQIVICDKDYSNLVPTLSFGGDYYDLENAQNIAFAPLSQIESEDDFNWACGFIGDLVVLQDADLTISRKAAIRNGLRDLLRSGKKFRTLTELSISIQDEEIRGALAAYLESPIMKRLLCAETDSMETSSFMSFEMGWLLKQKQANYLPVIKYLFRKLNQLFKSANPTLLILEEAWLYLDNEFFAAELKDWLKTLRKFNVSVIFTTQTLEDITTSKISTTLLESCSTKIYLPNDDMSPISKRIYEECGLNERQIEIIATAIPKSQYYVTNALGNRLIELGLGELAKSFLAVGMEERRDHFLKIYREGDESWVYDWLMHKGLSDWAAFWQKEYGKNPDLVGL